MGSVPIFHVDIYSDGSAVVYEPTPEQTPNIAVIGTFTSLDPDVFHMQVTAGQTYRVQTFGLMGTEVRILDEDGNIVTADIEHSGIELNGMLEFESPSDGIFTILVEVTSTFGNDDYVLLMEAR